MFIFLNTQLLFGVLSYKCLPNNQNENNQLQNCVMDTGHAMFFCLGNVLRIFIVQLELMSDIIRVLILVRVGNFKRINKIIDKITKTYTHRLASLE